MVENMCLIQPALAMLRSPIQADFANIANFRNQFVEQWEFMPPLSRQLRMKTQSCPDTRRFWCKLRRPLPSRRRVGDGEDEHRPVHASRNHLCRIWVQIEVCVQVDHSTPIATSKSRNSVRPLWATSRSSVLSAIRGEARVAPNHLLMPTS